MASPAITRSNLLSPGDVYNAGVVNTEIQTIVDTINDTDAGLRIWTSLKALLLTMSGNIVMATNKITGLGNGTAAQDAAAFGQIKVLQTVSATTTTSNSSSSTSYVSTALAASITPTSASNKVLVMLSGNVRITNVIADENNSAFYTIDRSGTDLSSGSTFGTVALLTTGSATNQADFPISIVYLDSPATTSSRTYTLQIKKGGGSQGYDFIAQNNKASIVLMEVV